MVDQAWQISGKIDQCHMWD